MMNRETALALMGSNVDQLEANCRDTVIELGKDAGGPLSALEAMSTTISERMKHGVEIPEAMHSLILSFATLAICRMRLGLCHEDDGC